MSLTSKLTLALGCAGILTLTGCQSIMPTKSTPPVQVEGVNQFNLQGKIGIRTPEQSGSAFFTWLQQNERFEIELNGILGMGKTQIQGQPGQVTLNSAKTGLLRATTPEALLKQATGWNAPITHLVSWIQGRPATLSAKTSQDAQGRITELNEDGWQVNLDYNANNPRPNRLILTQALEQGQQNRITLVIQNR